MSSCKIPILVYVSGVDSENKEVWTAMTLVPLPRVGSDLCSTVHGYGSSSEEARKTLHGNIVVRLSTYSGGAIAGDMTVDLDA